MLRQEFVFIINRYNRNSVSRIIIWWAIPFVEGIVFFNFLTKQKPQVMLAVILDLFDSTLVAVSWQITWSSDIRVSAPLSKRATHAIAVHIDPNPNSSLQHCFGRHAYSDSMNDQVNIIWWAEQLSFRHLKVADRVHHTRKDWWCYIHRNFAEVRQQYCELSIRSGQQIFWLYIVTIELGWPCRFNHCSSVKSNSSIFFVYLSRNLEVECRMQNIHVIWMCNENMFDHYDQVLTITIFVTLELV